jgi:uroporphyrinogen decarboxylase
MSLYLQAASGQDTRTAPVWVMRQAGRYLPEYRQLRAKHSFWELCRNPELAARVTLQPIERFGLDAAILFQDIMTPLPAMGISIDFNPGPVISEPLRSSAQVRQLRVPEQDEIAPFVAEEIHAVRSATRTPLIGFGGAPLTLATYLVEGHGSKDYARFRQLLRAEPATLHALLEKLTEVSIRYLLMQVEAGAQAIQLFDSWAGLHDARTYAEFALPYNQRILAALQASGVPRSYIAVAAGHLQQQIAQLPCEVISLDWRSSLTDSRKVFPGRTLQGNLDPALLLAPPEVLVAETRRVLQDGLGGAHIFNLGHGIMKETDPGRVQLLVDTIREFRREPKLAAA